MSFLGRLLLAVVIVVSVLQSGTYFAARAVLLDATLQSTRNAVAVGVDVFAQSLKSQTDQLKSSVSVLVNDFGFREAVATRDAGTIESALLNQAERIGADRAIVFDRDGMRLADTAGIADTQAHYFPELLKQADRDGTVAINLVLDQVPYVFVVASVRAPLPIGSVGMGFKLDARFAAQIKQLTQLDVEFLIRQRNSLQIVTGTLDAQTSRQLNDALQAGLPGRPRQLQIGDKQAMVVAMPLTDDDNLSAVLLLPMQQALQPYFRLSRDMFWLALGGFLFTALIAVFIARYFAASVRVLVNASARISSGDYSQRVTLRSRDELGDLAETFNQMQDAVVEREQRILFQAEHDQLTGLPNRLLALRILHASIEAARALPATETPRHEQVSVVVLDINHFKSINDAFGHGIGDQVLCHVAERTLTSVKQRDTVVRLGNDEFLLVLVGVDKPLAHAIAERLLAELARPLQLGELNFSIDAHIGIATFPEDGDAAEMLVRRADIAMARCKQESSNPLATRIAAYQPGWEELRLRRLALVHDLLDAIEHGGLQVKFQPKRSLRDPAYLGAEALVRWQHPQHGFIGPDEFIPLAESSGHIVALTRWVLDASIAQVAAWRRDNIFVKVSVNMSALDLLDETLPAYIDTTLKLHGVGAEQLCLELTESSVMFEVQRSMASLLRLRELGLRLSVDDFGTGYSSLAQLKKLPIDELKIDKSFVLKLDQVEDDRVIVHSTIELGHNMGLEVVAEGVETEASRAILRDLGCDLVQGYLLAKPLSATEFTQWVAQNDFKN